MGCGGRHVEGYINIDIEERHNPDLVCDIEKGLPYEDDSMEEIRAFDFLEHINPDKVIFVMQEIHRVLKPEGIFHFFVPSTDGRGAFQDPYHVSRWNINNFLYYCDRDWNALYPELPLFKVLELRNVNTSEHLRIIHVEGKIVPMK